MSFVPEIPELQSKLLQQPALAKDIADLIVSYLEQIGVRYVFGVPGGAIEPFYNALARSARRGGPRPVVARHESGGAFMAQGYARESGKLGVCCATTGPGTTNLITGAAAAYVDNVPLLLITAQTPLPTFGRGAVQESSCTAIDVVGMLQHCTRYSSLVSHPEQVEGKLVSAIMSACQAPGGPAHLSIPLDVMRSRSPVNRPHFPLDAMLEPPSLYDEDAVARLQRMLRKSRRPVFIVGSKCGEAIPLIMELAERCGARVVATPQGKGWVHPYHPLFRGVFGFAGHETAYSVLADPAVDLVLAIGTSLGEWSTNGWDQRAVLNDRLVHIHPSEQYFARSPMAQLHVNGRLLTIFQHLIESIDGTRSAGIAEKRRGPHFSRSSLSTDTTGSGLVVAFDTGRRFRMASEEKCHDDSTPIKPQRLMRDLTRLFPARTHFLADIGNSFAWTTHYLHPRATGTYRTEMGYGAMTWAIGNAVGTALASPGTPVVCITGDGSVLMGGQEITVAVAERLPVIFAVLNDRGYGMVKHGQRLGGAEPVAFELPPVDFCAMARAMGAEAHSVRSPQDLAALDITGMCGRPGPTLLDVHIDAEEVPPLGARMKVLAGAH
jgi:acetolactate synthase I/II/III large subunit